METRSTRLASQKGQKPEHAKLTFNKEKKPGIAFDAKQNKITR